MLRAAARLLLGNAVCENNQGFSFHAVSDRGAKVAAGIIQAPWDPFKGFRARDFRTSAL